MNIWKEIVDILSKNHLKIATMESCTGGGIANEITNISGSSSVLEESYVTYSNNAKIKHGVSYGVIARNTVYSDATAIEMAKAVKKLSNADVTIGVTGQLGRIDPNNPVDKLNYVWYAISLNSNIIVREIHVPDDNRQNQKKFVIEEIANTLLEELNFAYWDSDKDEM